ncbi:MAG: glycosyltransferase, partial [Kiritimatiellae bacterium]|nr:glycosyltransferase [Kiritimatiellia bacterium]
MKIAFVSLLAYPLFDPSCKGKFGGAEVQSVLVAQGLAALGHEVTVVTFDHGQPDAQDFNGLKVVKSIPAMSGKQAAKALASQATLLRVLRSINPDVVVQPA